jgi:hypothetical protein
MPPHPLAIAAESINSAVSPPLEASGLAEATATATTVESLSLGTPSLGTVLAVVATALLVFVSVGVIYLSTVEWRDRRRRGAAPPRP